jgi:hypothetical protein
MSINHKAWGIFYTLRASQLGWELVRQGLASLPVWAAASALGVVAREEYWELQAPPQCSDAIPHSKGLELSPYQNRSFAASERPIFA